MKSVKRTALASLSIIALIAIGTSCKKDSCTPPDVSANIIGKFIGKNTTNEVEFKTDGTYVDDNEYLGGVTINGVNYSDRTYAITNDSDSLMLTVSDPNGSGSSTFGYAIDANKCEEIIITTTIGISITTTLEKQ